MIIPFKLGAFLEGAVGPLAKRILAALGIGVISYAAVSTALNTMISIAMSHWSGIPSFTLQLLGLAGFGEAFGMLAAALTFRLTYTMTSKLGVIPK